MKTATVLVLSLLMFGLAQAVAPQPLQFIPEWTAQKEDMVERLSRGSPVFANLADTRTLTRLLHKTQAMRKDVMDVFVGTVGRTDVDPDGMEDTSDLRKMLDVAIERQSHMWTIRAVFFNSPEDGIARKIVVFETARHAIQFGTEMDQDIATVTRIIQNSNDPGVQAIAPQVRQVLRETKELWANK